MSDIGFDGVGSFLAGLVFLALAGFLLLPLLGLVAFHLFRRDAPWTPAVLGLLVSIVVLGTCAVLIMAGAEYAPSGTDDTFFLWGPGGLLLSLLCGIGVGLLARGRRPPPGAGAAHPP